MVFWILLEGFWWVFDSFLVVFWMLLAGFWMFYMVFLMVVWMFVVVLRSYFGFFRGEGTCQEQSKMGRVLLFRFAFLLFFAVSIGGYLFKRFWWQRLFCFQFLELNMFGGCWRCFWRKEPPAILGLVMIYDSICTDWKVVV